MNARSLCSLVLSGALTVAAAGCSPDAPTKPQEDLDFTQVLSDYVDHVVLGTYGDLRDQAALLHEATLAYAASPGDQALLDAAARAWVDTRSPWESSEAFLFGPVAFLSLDPSLDSWPVDRQQLESVLASSFDLTPEFIAQGLGSALRGFHTIEFLLFRDGQAREVGDVTAREREYLVAVTTVLADDAQALYDSWAVSYAGGPGYGEQFKNAGSGSGSHFSQRDAALEILDGMTTICDEVANGKIADPFDEKDVTLVESQFSWNSIRDFQDNLRSARNAYTGGYHHGTDGVGLDSIVSGKDAELDARLKAQMDAAIEAVGAVPHPFRNHLDADTEIQAAQQAILTVLTTLQQDARPLLSE